MGCNVCELLEFAVGQLKFRLGCMQVVLVLSQYVSDLIETNPLNELIEVALDEHHSVLEPIQGLLVKLPFDG